MSVPDAASVSRPTQAQFVADVAEYLQRTPRQLPSRYFYDALGSALFDAICRLPWYRITRAESSLLERFGGEMLAPLRRPLTLAELGCGSGEKLATVIERAGEPIRLVQLVDISSAALQTACDRLAALQVDDLVAHQGTYEDGLARVAAQRPRDGAMLVLFLGSNLGNFDPPAARDLLRRIRGSLREGDALLLGTDLEKPEAELLRAYDDPLQVTAAFNRNLLRRINDELGGTFDLDGFAHRARWNVEERRVEMHLVSRCRQTVRIAAADLELTFEPDDWIWTESSYKYQPAGILQAGRAAGFSSPQQWIDEDACFALTRFSV
jgi:L-histidine Nalpha-methyltransferase